MYYSNLMLGHALHKALKQCILSMLYYYRNLLQAHERRRCYLAPERFYSTQQQQQQQQKSGADALASLMERYAERSA
jgi:hypothetical protein